MDGCTKTVIIHFSPNPCFFLLFLLLIKSPFGGATATTTAEGVGGLWRGLGVGGLGRVGGVGGGARIQIWE